MGELRSIGKGEREEKRAGEEMRQEDKFWRLPADKWCCANCGRVSRSPWHSCRDTTDRKWVFLR
jgi:hypothetical protein